MLSFSIVLCVLCLATMLVRDTRLTLTAAALFLNWAVNSVLVWATNDSLCWFGFLAVDYLTALAIIGMMAVAEERPSPWQILIAGVYVGELIAHSAYGYSSQNVTVNWNYYWFLSYAAWAQLAMLGGWLTYEMVGGAVRYWGDVSPRHAPDMARSRASED